MVNLGGGMSLGAGRQMMAPVYQHNYGGPPPMMGGQIGGNVALDGRAFLAQLVGMLHAQGQSQSQIHDSIQGMASEMRNSMALRDMGGGGAGPAALVLKMLAQGVVENEVKRSLFPNDIDGMPASPSPTTVFSSGQTCTLVPLVIQAGGSLFRIISDDTDQANCLLKTFAIATYAAQLSNPCPLQVLDKRLDAYLLPIVGRIFQTTITITASFLVLNDNTRVHGLAVELYTPAKSCNLDPMSAPDARYTQTSTVTQDGNNLVKILRNAAVNVLQLSSPQGVYPSQQLGVLR